MVGCRGLDLRHQCQRLTAGRDAWHRVLDRLCPESLRARCGRSQTLYAVISVVVTIVQLTGALYVGSRSVGLLLDGTVLEVSYLGGVVALSVITGTYTIFGGLKAVIYTDVVQSVLLLAAGVLVAVLTFAQPEVGGWSGMLAFDAARPVVEQKMHLYLPSSHPDLPWSGALTGLLVLHTFYWSTNQRIVQRVLAAESDRQARLGIVVAGFLKLTIPFFAIAGGVAAAQLFNARVPGAVIDPDAATPELVRLVVPLGYELVGLVMAGLIGAILSTIDSMVNSAATLITFDLYKRFARPDADDRELLWLGRVLIALLITLSAVLAVATFDPTAGGNFFLRVSSQAGHFTPGLVAAFALGMFWQRATAAGAFAAIVAAPFFSIGIVELYGAWLGPIPAPKRISRSPARRWVVSREEESRPQHYNGCYERSRPWVSAGSCSALSSRTASSPPASRHGWRR